MADLIHYWVIILYFYKMRDFIKYQTYGGLKWNFVQNAER